MHVHLLVFSAAFFHILYLQLEYNKEQDTKWVKPFFALQENHRAEFAPDHETKDTFPDMLRCSKSLFGEVLMEFMAGYITLVTPYNSVIFFLDI